ncbi:MAG: hypothetical protein AB4058_16330 [Microcystaceae cyanobacterium]
MSSLWFPQQPILAQITEVEDSPSTPDLVDSSPINSKVLFLGSGFIILVAIAVAGFCYYRFHKVAKALKFEEYKTRDLKKKLKLALVTIRKMEANPDLVHARGFNLDYLRMRMDEEVFHYVIVNQIKMKVTQIIGIALRPSTDKVQAGIVAGGRQIDEGFDVTYEVETQEGKWNKGVLFRIQIKLTKLPTQSTPVTIEQIIHCIETFLAPSADHHNWQPAIQGHVVYMSWDQKAKPTPLLVIEQSEEGVNVSMRTNPVHHNQVSSKAKAVRKSQTQLPQ